MNLEEFFTAYLIKEGSSKRTQKNYLADLRSFTTFLSSLVENKKNIVITDISTQHITLYREYLIGLGQSTSTIQRRLSSLKTLFTALKNNKVIASNPFPNTPEEKQKRYHPLLHVFMAHQGKTSINTNDSEEIQQFLNWVTHKN